VLSRARPLRFQRVKSNLLQSRFANEEELVSLAMGAILRALTDEIVGDDEKGTGGGQIGQVAAQEIVGSDDDAASDGVKSFGSQRAKDPFLGRDDANGVSSGVGIGGQCKDRKSEHALSGCSEETHIVLDV